jgi:hypothetical protein
MSWTCLGFVIYICVILNYCYGFYSFIQIIFINAIISTATYLILIYAVAIIEEESARRM